MMARAFDLNTEEAESGLPGLSLLEFHASETLPQKPRWTALEEHHLS